MQKKILILGLGLSGQSAARFLLKRKAEVFAIEDNLEKVAHDANIAGLKNSGLTLINSNQEPDLRNFDLVVTSPGVAKWHPYYQQARDIGIEVIGEVELACRELKGKCLAITGTNGKTSVAMLTTHILNMAGKTAFALGNIGIPLTQAIDDLGEKNEEIFSVIELSSFQLETLSAKFVDTGIILNITPDHLDRYASFEAYGCAKIGLQKNIKKNGKLFIDYKSSVLFKEFLTDSQIYTFGYSNDCSLYTDKVNVITNGKKDFILPKELQGKVSIDLENLLAAYILCKEQGLNEQQCLQGYASFKKPLHRIQFVREVDGKRYYDDSKGTNIDSVVRAVECMSGEVILIAGGVDKGASYKSWIKAFAGKVKLICAIGQAAEKMKNELDSDISIRIFTSLEQAVLYATAHATFNSNILLSPGCSSFDMFKDYAHRGCEFQRIVHAL